MSDIKLRINGRGNAWPVILGQDHPFYDRTKYEDMANASCSIIKSEEENPSAKDIEWELMIDAGHGAAQFLLKYCNRIPEALFISHPHIDHTLGIDWIIQSYFKQFKKPYPVYATILCWEKIKQAFPQLESMVCFKELIPFKKTEVSEARGVMVQAFPVYHGKSADGAVMLYFNSLENHIQSKILITGDVLCPLLRAQDYNELRGINILVVDANNRFPYPDSNHWSIVNGLNFKNSDILLNYIENCTNETLLFSHIKKNSPKHYVECFKPFVDRKDVSEFCFSINKFAEKVLPDKIVLLHYSGSEDEKYYKENRLSESDLLKWLKSIELDKRLNTDFIIPYVSQHIKIASR